MNTMTAEISSQKSVNTMSNGGFGYGFATFQNPSWTVEQLLEACGGTLLYGQNHAGFRSISTDSRTVKPGDVFVALNGEKFAGVNFIDAAIKGGATCVVTSQLPITKIPVPCILVEDTLKALGDLAAYRRVLVDDLQVLAITGSSGKTTVKEMTSSILERKGNVLKTRGNFNNLIGLPLSLLPLTYRHDFAVLEMGMNKPGEIDRLTQIAKPNVACIINVHGAHLEGLGSIEGVAKAKGELFNRCDKGTILIVNIDDKRVAALAAEKSDKQITFGSSKKAFVRAAKITSKGEAGMAFTLHVGEQKAKVRLQAFGVHNVTNSLAAAALAYAVGAGITDIVKGLEEFGPGDKRLEIVILKNGLKVVNDSYNANPASMQAALETVSSMKKGVKTVAVLGDMLELGKYSKSAHQQVGSLVARNKYDYFLAVGEYAKIMTAAACDAGMEKGKAVSFESKDKIASFLKGLVKKKKLNSGDYLLFKGSRGMAMETIISKI
jgi:UDP-N-acetylmuramoyl-tripeptide--D-alanyl-D-alanine ligase